MSERSMPSVGSSGLRIPHGIPSSMWRRLRLFGSWASVAGKPLDVVSRPIHFDERSGTVRVAVASSRWAEEIAAYREILRRRWEARTGERILSLELTVAPGSFASVPVVRMGQDGERIPPASLASGRGKEELPASSVTATDEVSEGTDLSTRLRRLRDRYLAAAAARRP